MQIRALILALASLLAAPATATCPRGAATPARVDFVGMPAPATADEKADVYTRATLRMTCSDGTAAEYPLRYHQIFATTDHIGEAVVGGLFNATGAPLADREGQMASDSPDGTSLMKVAGLTVPGAAGNPLAMVTQFEYRELPPNDGTSSGSFWSNLPATMGLTLLDQEKESGLLTAKDYRTIDLSGVHGGWIPCGATLSAWNTHVGSEEYEPDAKVRGGGARAEDSDDKTDIASFSHYFFGDPAKANAYHYGLLPEVTVAANGTASVVKHYAAGRYAREMQIMAADQRTAIGGDDGKNTGLFMFVADNAGDLSAGTLYAAKVTPAGAADSDSFNLKWVRLGHATDAEIQAMVDGGIRFREIFDVAVSDPLDASYTKVVTYTGTEWLRLKPSTELDVQKAASFLETRRYAALLGATTKFSKMEYIAYNRADKTFYVAISRVEAGMADGAGDIQLARNDGGMILRMATAGDQQDTGGTAIASDFVGVSLTPIPELVGGWLGKGHKDAQGNTCSQDKICGPDNLVYVDSIRILFIGEDTDRRNNNYLWAFHIDTRKLSRVLSVPMAAEVTGLAVASDYNGYAYLMANFQHPGAEGIKGYKGPDKAEILAKINEKWGNRKKAAIGYVGTAEGALPALR
jgi:secreted PhoX family phosphatase